MMPILPVLMAAAMAQAAPAPSAAPADFSGAWMLDTTRSDTARGGGRIERAVVIDQQGRSFRITPDAGGDVETVTSEAIEPTASPAAEGLHPVAYWDGGAIVTERVLEVNGRAVTIKQSRTLAQGGAEMLVETNVVIHHGYRAGEPLPTGSARDVYVRTAR